MRFLSEGNEKRQKFAIAILDAYFSQKFPVAPENFHILYPPPTQIFSRICMVVMGSREYGQITCYVTIKYFFRNGLRKWLLFCP